MKESITSRVGRIISGSVHLLLQTLENAAPDAVMEQALREIDGVVDDIRTELGAVLARKHLASTRLMEENRKHEELTGKVELALREKRDDLAEAAAARQLDIEAQIPVLETTLAESGDREKELTGYITALLAKKREMEDELRQLRRAREQAQTESATEQAVADSPAARQVGHDGRIARAESAFDRVLERQTGVAANRPTTSSAAKLAELEDLSRKNRIQERLQAARARLNEAAGALTAILRRGTVPPSPTLMLYFVTASENLPFTAALGVMLVIGLIEGVFTMLGLGFSHIFDSLHHGGSPEMGAHADLDADHGLDPHHGFDLDKATPFLRFLDWLHVGKVPILVVFVVFLTMFGVTGLALQWTMATFFHHLLPGLLAVVPALAVSLPLVRASTGLLARVLPKDETEAVSEESFIGRVAVVTLGTARRGHPAQAKLRDPFGQTHYLPVEPDLDDETFPTGTAVLIVRRAGIVFRGIRNTTTALID